MIVDISEFKQQVSQTLNVDDIMLQEKLFSAQNHVERLLGFKIEERFGGADQEPVPDVLKEAVMQLAAWWYEQRETALVGQGVQLVPFGVWDIVQEYREYTFG